MRNILEHLGQKALDLLFPLRCLGCSKEGSALCQACQLSLRVLVPPYCSICAQPSDGSKCRRCAQSPLPIDGIRAPYLMEGVIREAIHSLKYRNFRGIGADLGRLLAEYLESNSLPVDILAPVLMHKGRLHKRGYNQAALLAEELGKRVGLPVNRNLLVRTKDSAPQVSLSNRAERARNVEGSFRCVAGVHGQRVLLVDDVATTGSTLSACALALKEGEAQSVWGLALAREP